MRLIRVFLIVIFCCVAQVRSGYAALPVKTTTPVMAAPVVNATPGSDKPLAHQRRHELVEQLRQRLHLPVRNPNDNRPGWPGIVALACAAGAIVMPIFAIPAAIVFGIIGLNKRYKNHGLALAGLILGVLELIAIVALIVALTNAFRGVTFFDVM